MGGEGEGGREGGGGFDWSGNSWVVEYWFERRGSGFFFSSCTHGALDQLMVICSILYNLNNQSIPNS